MLPMYCFILSSTDRPRAPGIWELPGDRVHGRFLAVGPPTGVHPAKERYWMMVWHDHVAETMTTETIRTFLL